MAAVRLTWREVRLLRAMTQITIGDGTPLDLIAIAGRARASGREDHIRMAGTDYQRHAEMEG